MLFLRCSLSVSLAYHANPQRLPVHFLSLCLSLVYLFSRKPCDPIGVCVCVRTACARTCVMYFLPELYSTIRVYIFFFFFFFLSLVYRNSRYFHCNKRTARARTKSVGCSSSSVVVFFSSLDFFVYFKNPRRCVVTTTVGATGFTTT